MPDTWKIHLLGGEEHCKQAGLPLCEWDKEKTSWLMKTSCGWGSSGTSDTSLKAFTNQRLQWGDVKMDWWSSRRRKSDDGITRGDWGAWGNMWKKWGKVVLDSTELSHSAMWDETCSHVSKTLRSSPHGEEWFLWKRNKHFPWQGRGLLNYWLSTLLPLLCSVALLGDDIVGKGTNYNRICNPLNIL